MKTKISLLVITIMALSIGNLYSGEWIVKHQFNSPTNSTYGLAWDGTYLWLSGSINMIYKLDPVDGNVITQFPINVMSRAEDLAWDGKYLWVCDKMSYASPKYLHKIDTTSKQIVESLAIYTLGTNLNGLTFCEAQLAAGDGGENIYFVNQETGQLENTLSLPSSIEPGNYGLTWDNVHLWLSHNNGTIYKLNKDNGEIVDQFEAPSGEDEGAEGLAWDGSYIWYADNTEDIIYQMELLEGCLPEGITFSTQAEIDSFQVNYPGCTQIEGDVEINGDDITNLNSLSLLTSVGGELLIGDSYPNTGNPLLSGLTGLDNLASISGDLNIVSNETLTSLEGLENLNSIGGSLKIGGNNALNNLEGLNYLQSVGGDLKIGYPAGYSSPGNPSLTTLIALNNLNSIGGDLWIGNNGLVSLTGLENLTSIPGDLYIGWGCGAQAGYAANPNLETLSGLDNLNSIGGNLGIELCPTLTSLTGLDNLTSIGGGYMGFACTGLTSLEGLNNMVSIGGSLSIHSNNFLADITSLNNLTSIPGYLYLSALDSLANLTGLDNVTSIGGYLTIGGPYSHNLSLTSLSGLANLNFIGGNVMIVSNDVLTSLSGLENITSIEGDLKIGYISYSGDSYGNASLTSINELDGIDASSIEDLTIVGNSVLSNCDAESICKNLASPNGTITIQNNAPGCNSPEEVEEACWSSVVEFGGAESFTLSPNPLESNTFIEYTLQTNSSVTLKILDLSGREMVTLVNETQQKGEQNVIFHTADLPAGVYFCVLKTDEGMQTRKMIKL